MTDHPVRVRTSTGWQDLALVGPAGPTGATGSQGPQGVKGDTGDQGPIGGSFPDAPSDGTAYNRKNAAWVADTGGGGSAATTTFAPTGNIAATNVQTALAEVDTEKVAKAGDTMTGALGISPLTGAATFSLDPVAATQQGNINFNQSAVGKWQLGKKSNNDFHILDVSNVTPIFTSPSNGTTVTFGKSVLLAADPTALLGAATKQYVDNNSGGGAASGVTFAPTGNVAATNVQAAIAELDSEKVSKNGDTMSAALWFPNGSESIPSISFSPGTTDGFYRVTNAVGVTVNGATKFSFGSTLLQSAVPLLINPVTGPASIALQPTAAAQQALVAFNQGAAGKWQVGKKTDDSFAIIDNVSAIDLFRGTTTSATFTRPLTINPPTGNALFNIDPTGGSSPAIVYLKQTGVSKWSVGKAIDQSFFIQDEALGQNILTAVSGAGVTIGRPLTLAYAPTVDMHAATKKYVDDKPGAPDDTKVLKAGDTMTGTLSINATTGGSALNLGPTTASQQATLNFLQSGVGKWQIGKQTDDSFFFFDIPGGNYIFTAPSGGTTVTFHKDVTMAGPTTHRGNCHWRFDGPAGSGSYYDTATVVDRFFLGSDSTGDTFRLFSAGTSTNAISVNGATGNVGLTSATASTSTTTGAVTVAGGLGVVGNIFAPAVYSNGIHVLQEVWGGACSDEITPITTGVNKLTFSIPYNFFVQGVYASVNTASSSGVPTIDINEAGVSILSTRITIDINEKTGGSSGYQGTAAAAAVVSDAYLAAFAEIGIDIDVAGTGAKGLKVFIIGFRY